jgi:CDP-glucose 4,6-dehydratase
VTGPHEANFLKLDCSLLRSVYGWKNVWNVRKAIEKTVEWTKKTDAGRPAMDVCSEEIDEFFADLHAHSEVQE